MKRLVSARKGFTSTCARFFFLGPLQGRELKLDLCAEVFSLCFESCRVQRQWIAGSNKYRWSGKCVHLIQGEQMWATFWRLAS